MAYMVQTTITTTEKVGHLGDNLGHLSNSFGSSLSEDLVKKKKNGYQQ